MSPIPHLDKSLLTVNGQTKAKERKEFKEFHIALGGLLLFKRSTSF